MNYRLIWDGGYAKDYRRVMRCQETPRRLVVLCKRFSVWKERLK